MQTPLSDLSTEYIRADNQKIFEFILLLCMNMADREKDMGSHRKGLPYWGVILIIIGVFALLDNLKIIPGLNWDNFWPVLLIFLGIMALYEYYQKRD